MHNQVSIYDDPSVKPLWDEYNARETLEAKDEILPQLLAAMGEIQKQRGQRTRDRYMGQAK